MDLSDSERGEFLALAADTFDPKIWDESDYPILKAANAEYEREQARERGELPPPATEHDTPV